MNILLFPFRILYKLYFLIYFIFTLVLFYPIFKYLLSRKERFPTAFKVIKVYAKVWLYGSGIFIRIKGKENIITNQPFLICSNHSSFIDPATLYAIFDQYFVFTGKKEIEKWPLFHIFYTSGMNILVDRHNRLGALKSFKKMMEVIDNGHPLVILPEGTIPKDAPKLGEFKAGAVSIAIQMGIPILPITQTTNWKRLQRGSLFKGNASPGVAEVIIHPLIPTTGLTRQDTKTLQGRLYDVINKPLQEKYGR
ncbi:lysophospholipid acyltransferase family protein [Ancylomarina longa]|uniref:1-acyl-sn-glycerol-3-phosphate acyltransferase n=1 Tax=Ancylomarina longa TaxID=2487017 RepID=A0A434AV70_9BACT|nr:lysophospholipid acyltransferase family protein [Ancylomarina longa]RUT78349.1 1-acyl-sn-glycerol-3-phosphate acyltransferase [Ancylomarina longa]